MAKSGFIYYSVDTNRYQDIKIKRLRKKFGCQGISIYDYLLCEIYRVRGYYVDWDENTKYDVSDYLGVTENDVSDVVNYCCEVGLFDSNMVNKMNVITSKSIQERYMDWSRKAKRTNFDIPESMLIVPEELPNIQEETAKLPEESKEFQEEVDKVKKSKVKKSKEEDFEEEVVLVMPFTSEEFSIAWRGWISYKLIQHKFKYKSISSEQIALKELSEISRNNESVALQIIQQSIAHGWKGLFELKNKNYVTGTATQQPTTRNEASKAELFRKFQGDSNNG